MKYWPQMGFQCSLPEVVCTYRFENVILVIMDASSYPLCKNIKCFNFLKAFLLLYNSFKHKLAIEPAT